MTDELPRPVGERVLQDQLDECQKLIAQYEAIPVEDMEEELATLRAEIERLRMIEMEYDKLYAMLTESEAENARLRGALEEILQNWLDHDDTDAGRIARAALSKGE